MNAADKIIKFLKWKRKAILEITGIDFLYVSFEKDIFSYPKLDLENTWDKMINGFRDNPSDYYICPYCLLHLQKCHYCIYGMNNISCKHENSVFKQVTKFIGSSITKKIGYEIILEVLENIEKEVFKYDIS